MKRVRKALNAIFSVVLLVAVYGGLALVGTGMVWALIQVSK